MGWEKTKCGAIHEASECQLRERREERGELMRKKGMFLILLCRLLPFISPWLFLFLF